MRVDWWHLFGCFTSILFCLIFWALLLVVLYDWYVR